MLYFYRFRATASAPCGHRPHLKRSRNWS